MALKGIDKFVKNNGLQKKEKDEKIILSNLWNDDSFELVFAKEEKLSILKDVFLPKELYGIYTKDCYEFIFQPLIKNYYCIDRKFHFIFQTILQKILQKKFHFIFGNCPALWSYQEIRNNCAAIIFRPPSMVCSRNCIS